MGGVVSWNLVVSTRASSIQGLRSAVGMNAPVCIVVHVGALAVAVCDLMLHIQHQHPNLMEEVCRRSPLLVFFV